MITIKPKTENHANLIAGFTLIELIIVVVILAILAVIAIPKYIDLTTDARISATNHLANILSDTNNINYKIRKENRFQGFPINNCTNIVKGVSAGLPVGYIITSVPIPVGKTLSCTLTGPGSTHANFNATGIN